MNNTPETDELVRSLTYEQLASTEKCYSEMRTLARRLELDRDEQCRLLGMSAERECDLRGELQRERALADRLAGVLSKFDYRSADYMHSTSTDADRAIAALAAWKEVRND